MAVSNICNLLALRAKGSMDPRLIREHVDIVFLERLKRAVGEDSYRNLIHRVTFNGETLSPPVLVKRLFVREHASIKHLSDSYQSEEWKKRSAHFLEEPDYFDFQCYLEMLELSSTPTCKIPFSGMSTLIWIMIHHNILDAAVKAIND